jgi:hypothetical protein
MAEETTILDNGDQQLFELVTDALRAGPGTPQWQAAMNAVPQAAADEYTQLSQIRETLASGRAYREVHPGPGFTRNVMAGVERESQRRDRPSITTWIITISAAVILMVLGTVGYFALPTGTKAVPNLNDLVFSEAQLESRFDNGISPGWHVEVSPGEPFAFEVVMRMPSATHGWLEAYIADRGQPTELTCVVRDGQAMVVLPGGHTAGETVKLQASELVTIRIVMSRESAYVECAGKRLWSGPHHLNPKNSWDAGVTFLKPSALGNAVQSVRIMRPAK